MKTLRQHHPICAQCNTGLIRRRAKILAAFAAAVLSLLPLGDVWAQSDNFNDNNDTGWTQYDPIAGVVPPGIATYTLTNGTYRIQTVPSPLPLPPPNGVGPGRAGSLCQDVTYTDFYVAVDVVGWNPDLNQAFGILARVRDVGLGQTDGYALTWARDGQDLDITRILNENPTGGEVTVSGNDKIPLVLGHSYRFVFIGTGPTLTGRVYELPNDTTPLTEIVGADTAYADGYSGLVLYDNTSTGSGSTDATFDNYLALPEEPPRLSFSNFVEAQEMEVTWPNSYTGYVLESSPVLPATTWTEEVATPRQDVYFHLEDSRTGNKFFRLRKSWPAGAAR
jgi:hypothetical protein